jgi:hypothetical protein
VRPPTTRAPVIWIRIQRIKETWRLPTIRAIIIRIRIQDLRSSLLIQNIIDLSAG